MIRNARTRFYIGLCQHLAAAVGLLGYGWREQSASAAVCGFALLGVTVLTTTRLRRAAAAAVRGATVTPAG